MSLTYTEKIELELLLRKQGLYRLSDDTNKNYRYLFNSLRSQKYDEEDELIEGVRGVVLEGSSRSGKTWSCVDLIIYICLFVESHATINIYRETFEEFKTTLYLDFKRRLNDFGLPNKFESAERVKSFKIGNNTINFIGCDRISRAHGASADYVYFNEMIHIPKEIFDHAEMRCQKFWFADYNPSVTEHYIFRNVLTREDVGYIRTTLLDNPHISKPEKAKIMGFEPWESGSYEVKDNKIYYQGKEIDKENQPPPNVRNIQRGSADEYMWKVYGLGLRGAMKGQIFPHVTYIKEFPEDLRSIAIFPQDFGFTVDPHACTRYAETEDSIFIELLTYNPIETATELNEVLENLGIEKVRIMPCDSSDKYVSEKNGTIEMVQELIDLGYSNAYKISKTHGVMYWLNSMKKKKIHIVINKHYKDAKTEQENYKLREINGIAINQPLDKFNHMWDSARYGHIAWSNEDQVFVTKEKDIRKLGIAY